MNLYELFNETANKVYFAKQDLIAGKISQEEYKQKLKEIDEWMGLVKITDSKKVPYDFLQI